MGAVRELADRYLRELAVLDPMVATYVGLPGGERALPDLSPEGAAEQAGLAARTLADLERLDDEDVADARCRALVQDRLGLVGVEYEAGEHLRPLGVMSGAPAVLRSMFDLMPTEGQDAWEAITDGMAAMPEALSALRRSYAEGVRTGVLAAPRQAQGTATQLARWSGADGSTPTFAALAAQAPATLPDALRGRLDAAAAASAAAMADLSTWLRDVYLPAAADVPDAVGRDRYLVSARQYLGGALDPEDAYAWAWDELARIEDEMARTVAEIVPGATLAEAQAWLNEHGEAIEGEENLRVWLQALMDDTIAALDGTHFDLAPPLRVVEAMIAPPGGAAAQYYTPPSADFSRPGRTWYPTMGRTRFPLWEEVTTCYHEGVPGHHLQLAQWIHCAAESSLFQSTFFVSGNGEGWALYAERLMDELGFFADPGRRLGHLTGQQLRATRVIVDIGMHLAMPIPTGQPFRPGQHFTPETGREFMGLHAGRDVGFLDSEWERYLGRPGQAICYKLGERVWLAGRDEARRRAAAEGRAFDLKAWHMAALSMGSTGLDHLAAELPHL